jgi:hypothetical protein
MRLRPPYLALIREIPDLYHAIARATCKTFQGVRIFRKCVNTILVSPAQLRNEWRGEDSLELCSVHRSNIFSSPCKGVKRRIEIPRRFLHKVVCSVRRLGFRKSLYLLEFEAR